jgi:sugar/nucleoside kinase (ribokinase family)
LRAAARALAALGPKEILITHKKGVLVYAEGKFHTGDFTPRKMMGRTGRGDTCFTTYCAKRLSLEPGEACAYAAAVTSLKMEAPGPFTGTAQDVETFLKSL